MAIKGVVEESEGGADPLSVIAIGISCVLGVLISYNALWAQQGEGGRMPLSAENSPGLSARVEVDLQHPNGNTVVLRYDPAVEEVQRALLDTGDYTGLVDGVTGRQTKLAISNYQRKQGLAPTGEVSPELLENIRYARQIAKAAEFTGSIEPPTVQPEAQSASAAQLRNVQTTLSELGYQPGDITGHMTSETGAAIARFQHDRNLTVDGQVSIALLSELAKLSGDTTTASQMP